MIVLLLTAAVEARAASSTSQPSVLAAPSNGVATESGARAAAEPRRAYEHDGFYHVSGLGFGGVHGRDDFDDENAYGEQASGQVTGIASVGEVAIGSAVRRNLILGGGLWTSTLLASTASHRRRPDPERGSANRTTSR